MGWGCDSVGTALDRHATDAGLSPWCGKGFFFQSPFSADCLTVSVHPCVQSHALTSVCTLTVQSLVDDGNTKTPSMYHRFGSATHLAFPWESNPNFPWEKSQWDNTVTVVKTIKIQNKIYKNPYFLNFSEDRCKSTRHKCLKKLTSLHFQL